MSDLPLRAIVSAYGAEIIRAAKTDVHYAWAIDEQTVVACVVKMLQAVASGGKCDWYKQNPAMRRAGKGLGLKTSRDFRETVKRLIA